MRTDYFGNPVDELGNRIKLQPEPEQEIQLEEPGEEDDAEPDENGETY